MEQVAYWEVGVDTPAVACQVVVATEAAALVVVALVAVARVEVGWEVVE